MDACDTGGYQLSLPQPGMDGLIVVVVGMEHVERFERSANDSRQAPPRFGRPASASYGSVAG